MQDDTDLDYERYKDWDFSQARPARHNPIIKKIQDNARKAKQTKSRVKKHRVVEYPYSNIEKG